MSKHTAQSIEEKHNIEPVENVDTLDKIAAGHAIHDRLREELVKSTFDTLTVSQALWVFRRCFIFILLAFTGYVMEGYEVTMSGSIIANKGFIRQFGSADADGVYKLNSTWVAGWGAIINLGQIVSATHIGWIADRYGRRKTLLLGWTIIILTVARTPAVWLIGKLALGAAIGVPQVMVLPYTMEITPNRCRGAMMVVGLIWHNIGAITCSIMMNFVNLYHPYDWLLPIYIEYGMVATMLICYLSIPETPWFYCRRGQKDRALRSMRRLYNGVQNYDYEEEYGIMVKTIDNERELARLSEAQSWSKLFKGPDKRRTFVLLVMVTGEIVGGNALVSVYSTYFFQLAGLKSPFQATMIQNCAGLLAIVLYVVLIDRIGRRWAVCSTFSLQTAVLFTIGGLYYSKSPATGTVLLVMVCLWQPCFSLYTKTYFIVASELPSLQLRVKTGTLAWIWQAILGMPIVFSTPPLLAKANIRAAWLYAGLSLPVCILNWFHLPETMGRSVAEMDELFQKRIPAWRVRNYVTDVEKHLEVYLETQQKEAKLPPSSQDTV